MLQKPTNDYRRATVTSKEAGLGEAVSDSNLVSWLIS